MPQLLLIHQGNPKNTDGDGWIFIDKEKFIVDEVTNRKHLRIFGVVYRKFVMLMNRALNTFLAHYLASMIEHTE